MTDVALQELSMVDVAVAPASVAPAVIDHDGEKDVDPGGMWFRARARYGIDDRMWFGFYLEEGAAPEWHRMPHRDYDGIGALALLVARRFLHDLRPLPEIKGKQPGFWEMLRAKRPRNLPKADVRWRYLDHRRAGEQPVAPSSSLLSEEESLAVEACAKKAGVNSSLWLMWTADRVTRELLAEPDSVLPWVYPVSLRGAVRMPRWSMNHISGVTPTLTGTTTPRELSQQVRARFVSLEHWRTFFLLHLGRWIGQRGIDLLYALTRTSPGKFGGCYTMCGEWDIPGVLSFAGAAPTSPGYPVSFVTATVRGRRSLTCRLHPVVEARPGLAQEWLRRWRELSTTPPLR